MLKKSEPAVQNVPESQPLSPCIIKPYVLNDDNVREMRKVTIGLIGNDYVEITGGVSENDRVILRKS